MTVGQIASKVCWYFKRPRTDFIDPNGGDTLIDAINAARLDAERVHDFVNQEGQATATLDPANGCDLSTAVQMLGDTITSTPVDIKTLNAVYVQDPYWQNNQIWYPVLVSPKSLLEMKAKEYLYRYGGIPSPIAGWDTPLVRYPGDIYAYNRMRVYKAYWQNRRLFMDPRPQTSMTLAFDCNSFMTPYVANAYAQVLTSSTSSPNVTLDASNTTILVPGNYLLGQEIFSVTGSAVVLEGNANQTISSNTQVPYSNFSNLVNNEDWTDWMTEKGADYLMWAAICQINYNALAYVVRSEGFLAPPDKFRDNAFANLVQWDAYQMESTFTPRFLMQ